MAVLTAATSPASWGISMRSYLTAGVAVTAAGAIAFTPLIVPGYPARPTELAHMSTTSVDLTAITSADIDTLVANLNTAVNSVSSTITPLAAAPGQTLAGALNSAVAVNKNLWDALIAANGNRVLDAVLSALKAASHGGLSKLADTVGASNDTLILTTGEVANILTSTLTGSLGTALQAVANVVANPLRASSYTGLLTAPFDLTGLALHNAVTATNDLGANGLTLAGTLVTGVTAQISNSLAAVNALLRAAEGVSDFALVDGVLVAVQGIVSAPVTATVAGVNGLTSTITNAARRTLNKLSVGAAATVDTWLGDGTTPGALQAAINVIGAAPLSPASYNQALTVLVGAGIRTAQVLANTANSLASVPFKAAADLTNTAANMITSFSTATATVARGILQAIGLPSIVYNMPYALSGAFNVAVKVAAGATSTGLNTIAFVLDIGTSLSGALTEHPLRQLASDTPTSGLHELEYAAASDISDLSTSTSTATQSSTPKVTESSPTTVTSTQASTNTAADTTSSTETPPSPTAPTSATAGPATSAPATSAVDEPLDSAPGHTATSPETTSPQEVTASAASGDHGVRDVGESKTPATIPGLRDREPSTGRHAARDDSSDQSADSSTTTGRTTNAARHGTGHPAQRSEASTAAPATPTGGRHARPEGTARATTNHIDGHER